MATAMPNRCFVLVSSLAVCASLCLAGTATSSIGVVVSDGRLRLNNSETLGNATVLDGSSVQTGVTASSLRLNNGARITFGSDSRGTVSINRTVLEQGSARIAGYSVNANNLNVYADQASSATVAIRGKVIEVAALAGSVHVFSAAGVNVANLLPGEAINLEAKDSAEPARSSVTGCVSKNGPAFFLTDATSKVSMRLHGENLKAGQKVQVSGNIITEPNAAPGDLKGLDVVKLTALRGSCKGVAMAGVAAGSGIAGGAAAGAGGAAAGAGAAAGVAAGVATGAGISGAVIAGVSVAVAAAGTVAGLAVTQTFSGSSLSNGR